MSTSPSGNVPSRASIVTTVAPRISVFAIH
jgi:hypothetical protein